MTIEADEYSDIDLVVVADTQRRWFDRYEEFDLQNDRRPAPNHREAAAESRCRFRCDPVIVREGSGCYNNVVMGIFSHPITFVGPSGATMSVDALVDTGATFTTIPTTVLEQLGVRSNRRVRLRLANGQVAERRLGRVLARLDGLEEEILCLFGEEGGLATIGAHTMEAFLLAVDPIEKRLVPTEALWA